MFEGQEMLREIPQKNHEVASIFLMPLPKKVHNERLFI